MPKQAGRVGGFTALNSGEIADCYSVMRFNIKRNLMGGFASENNGDITNSFFKGSIRRLSGGVSASGRGKAKNSYCFHNEPGNSKKLQKLPDRGLAMRSEAITTRAAAEKLGFNMSGIWKHVGGSEGLCFISEKWFHDIKKSPKFSRNCITITTAKELFEFARKINEGDRKMASAYVRLNQDINLGGKEWTPIGNDLATAFCGLFDGCGHTIENFIIKSKNTKAKGFFGYLKGEVYNLTVDCVIKCGKETTAGGIAAYCEEGVIGCCAAIAEIKCGGGNAGGLIGSNTGKIFQSYSAGIIASAGVSRLWLLPLLLLPLIPILLLLRQLDDIPYGAPIPPDPGIQRVLGDIDPRTDRNFVSFQFEREIDVNLKTGECLFNFVNPGVSNHDVVVQLQFSDAQAASIMGSTGRADDEQRRLDENPQYDPETQRTVIAESGAIPPGYQLENLLLTTHPNGATIPPGEYSAIVSLIFYDIGTHNRAMVESQFPVIISVRK